MMSSVVFNEEHITVVNHILVHFGQHLYTKCTYYTFLWLTGGVPVSGVSTVPIMDQRGHLFVGRNPQSGSPSVCAM